ncbi:hypothetical protein ISCGN_001308 [Ixodes scapularis]
MFSQLAPRPPTLFGSHVEADVSGARAGSATAAAISDGDTWSGGSRGSRKRRSSAGTGRKSPRCLGTRPRSPWAADRTADGESCRLLLLEDRDGASKKSRESSGSVQNGSGALPSRSAPHPPNEPTGSESPALLATAETRSFLPRRGLRAGGGPTLGQVSRVPLGPPSERGIRILGTLRPSAVFLGVRKAWAIESPAVPCSLLVFLHRGVMKPDLGRGIESETFHLDIECPCATTDPRSVQWHYAGTVIGCSCASRWKRVDCSGILIDILRVVLPNRSDLTIAVLLEQFLIYTF